MKTRSILTRLASLTVALILAVSLIPMASAASNTSGMGNFTEVRSDPQFTDVSDEDFIDVSAAYRYGLINGKSSAIFDPKGNITIAEALTIAGRAHAIYFGITYELDTSRSPWYSDAVEYAINYGIIEEGEYSNYGAPATRADLANLFYCIPSKEFPRINRIAWISDVPLNAESNWIYMLYNAGVLTGVSDTGAFLPNNYITRVDATRIINRVIIKANRKAVSLTTMAPGKVTTGANGDFRLSIQENLGWETVRNEVDEDGWCFFTCMKVANNEGGALGITTVPKASYSHTTLHSFAGTVLSSMNPDLGENDLSDVTVRGLNAYSARFTDDGFMQFVYFVENSTQLYRIQVLISEDSSDTLWNELVELLYTLDIAL